MLRLSAVVALAWRSCLVICTVAPALAYDAILSGTALTYDQAEAHCRSLGRRLPVIETPAQMAAMDAKCNALGRASDCTWLALRCNSGTAACNAPGAWYWFDGDGERSRSLAGLFQPSTGAGGALASFLGGLPLNRAPGGTEQPPGRCASTTGPHSSSGFTEWSLTSCNNQKFALCEKPHGGLSVGATHTLPPGFNKIVSMAADESFVFAAMYTGQIVKMNQLDLSDFGVMNLNSLLGALAVDAVHAYVFASGPPRLLKIDKSQMSVVDSLSLSADADAVAERGGHVYLGMGNEPATVLKVDKASMTAAGQCTLSAGGDIRSMEFDRSVAHVLYANAYTEPGTVVKLNVETMTELNAGALDHGQGEAHILGGADQGTHVVVGTATTPANLVRLRKADMVRDGSLKLPSTDSTAVAVVVDHEFTYAGLYSPAKIVRVKSDTMLLEQTLSMPSADKVVAMATAPLASRNKLFVGTDASPAQVIEVVGLLRSSSCRVSQWAAWSACSKSCGGGVRHRQRSIVAPAVNGGSSCPSKLAQSQICNAHIPCPHVCKDGMVWTDKGVLPRPTCLQRTPTPQGANVAMCACPPARPYLHNHGLCVSAATCDAHLHSTICAHISCEMKSGRVHTRRLASTGNLEQPYRCTQTDGRLGGCVCMCQTGATAPPPTPSPSPCFIDAMHYADSGQVGGLLANVASAAACQSHCVANPLCAHWSYQIAGFGCYLFNHGATPVSQQPGFISGPKVCPRAASLHPYDDPQFLATAMS